MSQFKNGNIDLCPYRLVAASHTELGYNAKQGLVPRSWVRPIEVDVLDVEGQN
jgi:hypothetical protein